MIIESFAARLSLAHGGPNQASPVIQIEREFRQQLREPPLCADAMRMGKIDVRRGLGRDPVAVAVILTSSIGAAVGVPAKSVYSVTRVAIGALARSWIVDLKGMGIRINVLTPGSFVTEGMRAAFPDESALSAKLAQIGAAIPLSRVGDPAELTNVVAFLASDASSYLNGADIQVDGGLGQI